MPCASWVVFGFSPHASAAKWLERHSLVGSFPHTPHGPRTDAPISCLILMVYGGRCRIGTSADFTPANLYGQPKRPISGSRGRRWRLMFWRLRPTRNSRESASDDEAVWPFLLGPGGVEFAATGPAAPPAPDHRAILAPFSLSCQPGPGVNVPVGGQSRRQGPPRTETAQNPRNPPSKRRINRNLLPGSGFQKIWQPWFWTIRHWERTRHFVQTQFLAQ